MADVYRCVDHGGRVSYRDSECPPDAVGSANITASVQACSTPECDAKREQERARAEERLRTERAALDEMQQRRLRAEELDLERRLKLEELGRLQALEERLAAQSAADSGVHYPVYPWYGGIGYPGYGRPPVRPCTGPGCGPRPSRPVHRPGVANEPAVNVIAPGPALRRPK